MTSLADQSTDQAFPPSFKHRAESLVNVLQWLETCNREHKGKLIEGCPICTFRAFNAAQCTHKDLDVAYAFIAKLDKEEIRTDLQAMANAWGNDAPAWLVKEAYRS